MRIVPFAWVFLALLQLPAQQTSTDRTVPSVLEGMKSSAWTERSKAFGQASEALASGKLNRIDTDRLKLAIIQLLIAENALANVPDDEESKWSAKRASSPWCKEPNSKRPTAGFAGALCIESK
jgi:hypothetical protein